MSPGRRVEQSGQTHQEGRKEDSRQETGGRIPQLNSGRFRRDVPDDFKDRSKDSLGISWVIVGGESGPGHRPMDLDWARSIRDQCRAAGVPFFFKQSSGPRPGTGIELDGEVIQEFPVLQRERTPA